MNELVMTASPFFVLIAGVILCLLGIAWRRSVNMVASIAGISFLLAACLVYGWFNNPQNTFLNLLIIDNLSAYFAMAMLLSCGALTVIATSEILGSHNEEWYVLMLLSSIGGLVMICSRNVASLFLGLELLSIPLYAMMGYRQSDAYSLEAALKYLILASVAAGFMLMGFALIYLQTGSLDFAAMAHMAMSPTATLGMGLVIVAFAFKLALVPFHFWAPEVYDGVPIKTMIFVATASKAAVIAAFIRLVTLGSFASEPILQSVLFLGAFSAVVAGWLLLFEKRFLRMLAYSSTVHMAYWVSLAALAPSNSLPALMFLVGYLPAVMTIGACLIGAGVLGEQARDAKDFRGLAERHPWLAVTLAISLLSLLGMPLSAGFVIKFLSFSAMMSSGYGLSVLFLALGSILSLLGYLSWIREMWLPGEQANVVPHAKVNFKVKSIAFCAASLVVAFGVLPGLFG